MVRHIGRRLLLAIPTLLAMQFPDEDEVCRGFDLPQDAAFDPKLFADLAAFQVGSNFRILPLGQKTLVAGLQCAVIACQLHQL